MNQTVPRQPSLEQRRAAFAVKKIRELQSAPGHEYYVSYVSALPATIVMNGLGQALATLIAKAKGNRSDTHRLLYDHVAEWLGKQIIELRVPGNDSTLLIDRLMEADQSTYVRAQAEAMAYLNWLKQFARAYLKEKQEAEDV